MAKQLLKPVEVVRIQLLHPSDLLPEVNTVLRGADWIFTQVAVGVQCTSRVGAHAYVIPYSNIVCVDQGVLE
jgi:hypothetical protein